MTARMTQSAPSPGNTIGDGRQKRKQGGKYGAPMCRRVITISNVLQHHGTAR